MFWNKIMFWNKKQKEVVSDTGAGLARKAQWSASQEHIEREKKAQQKLAELDLKIKQAACEHDFEPKMKDLRVRCGASLAWTHVETKECIHCELQKEISVAEYKKLTYQGALKAYNKAKSDLNEHYDSCIL